MTATGEIIDTKKHQYKRLRVRGPDGRVMYSATANDAVSRAMFGMTKAQLIEVIDANDMGERFHVHSRKNVGHFKMILGQALRDRVKKGGTVRIGTYVIESLSQRVELPPGYMEVPDSLVPVAVSIKVRGNRR